MTIQNILKEYHSMVLILTKEKKAGEKYENNSEIIYMPFQCLQEINIYPFFSL